MGPLGFLRGLGLRVSQPFHARIGVFAVLVPVSGSMFFCLHFTLWELQYMREPNILNFKHWDPYDMDPSPERLSRSVAPLGRQKPRGPGTQTPGRI